MNHEIRLESFEVLPVGKRLLFHDLVHPGDILKHHHAFRGGNERETFFNSQMSVAHEVKFPQKGDFLVNDRYLFEVGGKNKTFDQIKDIPDSFLAVDETEVGFSNRIPLWMFGMTY